MKKLLLIILVLITTLSLVGIWVIKYGFTDKTAKDYLLEKYDLTDDEIEYIVTNNSGYEPTFCMNEKKDYSCDEYVPKRIIFNFDNSFLTVWRENFKVQDNYEFFVARNILEEYYETYLGDSRVYLYFLNGTHIKQFYESAKAYIDSKDNKIPFEALEIDNDEENKIRYLDIVLCVPINEEINKEKIEETINKLNEIKVDDEYVRVASIRFVKDDPLIEPSYTSNTTKYPYIVQEIEKDRLEEQTLAIASYEKESDKDTEYGHYFYRIRS